ncbi:Yos1-like protein [Zopfochytrium polystomum]|nr:Yos1-like protein [Zopfochytrium polystomum]
MAILPFASFGQIFYFGLLLVNAVAILHEQRFLARIGLGDSSSQVQQGYGQTFDAQNSITARIVNLISAVRTLLRIPLIGLNLIVILYELLLGSL